MNEEEKYNVEEDISISKEPVDSENKSMEKNPWLILVLCQDLVQIKMRGSTG